MGLIEKIFGDLNEKEVKKVSKIADKAKRSRLFEDFRRAIKQSATACPKGKYGISGAGYFTYKKS